MNPSPLCLPVQSPSQMYSINGFGLPTRPPLFPNSLYSNGVPPPPFSHMQQQPFISGIPPMFFNLRHDTKNINKQLHVAPPFNFHQLRMTPPPPLPFVPTPIPCHSNNNNNNNTQQLNNKPTTVYKFLVKLSDGTQHHGTGTHKQQARMNAATQVKKLLKLF